MRSDFEDYGLDSWRLRCAGVVAGVEFEEGHLDPEGKDHVATFSLFGFDEFPAHLKAPFKWLMLANATCAKCGGRTSEIMLRPLRLRRSMRRPVPCVVCCCGHPVWRISFSACGDATQAISSAERVRQRKVSLREAGGKHDATEIQEILALQENRCIYCNIRIDEEVRATKDHLVPVTYGGTDWALNIVLACLRCNARRGNIPFRTYCRLLSPAQNRRILKSLGRRLAALDLDALPEGAFAAFCDGVAGHQRGHGRFRLILRESAVARRNAAANQLLPCSPAAILKRYYSAILS